MAKKIKSDKKLYVATPLYKMQDNEIGYISSSFVYVLYNDSIQSEEYHFMISKRACYIKIPDKLFDMKVTRVNGEFIVDVGMLYEKNIILSPEPLSCYEESSLLLAQKINYAYFTRKRSQRLSFLTAIDEMIILADSVYKYGPLSQEDRDRFDYLTGWTENKFPQWANTLSISQIITHIDNFNDDIEEIKTPYVTEGLSDKDYSQCDLSIISFLMEIIENLEQSIIIQIKNIPILINSVSEEEKYKLISQFKDNNEWELLAELRNIGISIPN